MNTSATLKTLHGSTCRTTRVTLRTRGRRPTIRGTGATLCEVIDVVTYGGSSGTSGGTVGTHTGSGNVAGCEPRAAGATVTMGSGSGSTSVVTVVGHRDAERLAGRLVVENGRLRTGGIHHGVATLDGRRWQSPSRCRGGDRPPSVVRDRRCPWARPRRQNPLLRRRLGDQARGRAALRAAPPLGHRDAVAELRGAPLRRRLIAVVPMTVPVPIAVAGRVAVAVHDDLAPRGRPRTQPCRRRACWGSRRESVRKDFARIGARSQLPGHASSPPVARAVRTASPTRTVTVTEIPSSPAWRDHVSTEAPWRAARRTAAGRPPSSDASAAASAAVWARATSTTSPANAPRATVRLGCHGDQRRDKRDRLAAVIPDAHRSNLPWARRHSDGTRAGALPISAPSVEAAGRLELSRRRWRGWRRPKPRSARRRGSSAGRRSRPALATRSHAPPCGS